MLNLTELNRQNEMYSTARADHSGKNKDLNSYEAEIEKIEKKARAATESTRNEREDKKRLAADLKKALNKAWKAGDKAAYERTKNRIAAIEEEIELLQNREINIVLSVLSTEKHKSLVDDVIKAAEKSEKDHCKKAAALIKDLLAVSLESVAEHDQASKMLAKLTNTMMNEEYSAVLKDYPELSLSGKIELFPPTLAYFAMMDSHYQMAPIIKEIEAAAGR